MSELKSRDIESRFEELENCIMSEYVRDELSRLKNDCVALISTSPWIRFEDRKPEEGQLVFAAVFDGLTFAAAWVSRWHIEEGTHATHWMPIPEVE